MPDTDLTPEQQQRAQVLYEEALRAAEGELREMADLLAARPDGQLLGNTEFQIRDLVHRVGARMLQDELQHRQKKTTPAPAPPAPTATKTPSSRETTDPRRS